MTFPKKWVEHLEDIGGRFLVSPVAVRISGYGTKAYFFKVLRRKPARSMKNGATEDTENTEIHGKNLCVLCDLCGLP